MQICLIYFQSCVIKCQGPVWLNGTTVHYILFNREFGMFNLEWLAQYPLLINMMTHGALLFEFALAFWLWFRPTRRWAILGGIMLHLGIRPVLNVPGFGEVMIATYLTFLAPDELQQSLAIGSTPVPRSLDLARCSRSPTSGPPAARSRFPPCKNWNSHASGPNPFLVPSRWRSGKIGKMTWATWAVFVATELVLCLTPGPAVLFVVSQALRQGGSKSIWASLGILSGNAFYFLLSAAGLGAALLASHELFRVLKWCGAIYLVYLGLRLILRPGHVSATADSAPSRSKWALLRQGFVLQTANPKALDVFRGAVAAIPRPGSEYPGPDWSAGADLGSGRIPGSGWLRLHRRRRPSGQELRGSPAQRIASQALSWSAPASAWVSLLAIKHVRIARHADDSLSELQGVDGYLLRTVRVTAQSRTLDRVE